MTKTLRYLYTNNMKNKIIIAQLVLIVLLCLPTVTDAQLIDAPVITLTRGKLWHSLYFGKSGPGSFNNWGKTGIGLDWPGFDETKIKEDIDGSPSYLSAGGLIIGCKKDQDSALAVEEWSQYAGSVSNEFTSKYIVKEHKKYSDNFGMLKRAGGEETIETVWEYNPNFPNTYEPQRQLPLRVTRRAHQWSGSMREENYIIYEYVIKNISPELQAYKDSRKVVDTLYDFYAMFSYGIHTNSRSWSVFFPTLTPGARNTVFTVDTLKKDYNTNLARTMVYGRAGDYKDENGVVTAMGFGYAPTRGQKIKDAKTGQITPSGEWLSPGFAGIRLLASPPDKIRRLPNKINKIAWSAVDNNADLGGPLTGRSGLVDRAYSVLVNPGLAYNAILSTTDPLMGSRRMWTMMSLGPWDILPGDSIVIVIAEIVRP
ncbi:MAG: hypothetical protein Q8903_06110 [Bacteroidota bacterium]|nr:hypothetical protein [Bacteroidota bacterium]